MSGTIYPLVMTAQGAQPTPPATLNAEVIAQATSLAPGLSVLPGGLVEDMSSTATGALIVNDQIRNDLVNSMTPFGANAFILNQLGQVYLGQGATNLPASNTSVYVVFSGPPGFIIGIGFEVSDGTNQYITPDGGIINSGSVSQPIFFQGAQQGSWPVIANTVTDVVTSIPSGYTITATNPLTGTPGGAAETEEQFRARVLQSGLVAATGMPNYLKTLLQQIPGAIVNQISVRTPSTGQWEVIVGGTGDPYQIALAIFQALQDVSTLVGSTILVDDITATNPGTVTTDLNHGYAVGQSVTLAAINPGTYDGTFSVGTIVSPTQFTIDNTTGKPAYVNGGTVTPNFRNTSAAIISYPDTYTIPIVLPPAQTVIMTVTWNTSSSNYVSPTSIAQLAQPAIADYINGLFVGMPINEGVMATTFYAAIASVLAQDLVTTLTFSVTVNGVQTAVEAGTQIIVGDPESFWSCAADSINVVQG